MSRARDYRRGKDGRAEDRFAGRKRRYQPVLQALGLERAFAALPRWAQEQFWAAKFPDPKVTWEGDVPEAGRRAVEETLANMQMYALVRPLGETEDRPVCVPARDFPTVLYPLYALCQGTPPDTVSAPLAAFIRAAWPVVSDAYGRYMQPAINDLAGQAQWVLVGQNRADARVVGMRAVYQRGDESGGRADQMCLALNGVAEAPQRVRATLPGPGEPRPAYRVGYSDASCGIRWVSWRARELGVGPEDELPVFVQSHALRHFHERMDIPDAGPWMEYYLGASLNEPKIVRRLNDGDWLVEFRMNEHRCGYLVVGRADCGLVVRTFLFLTMTGTPEGDRLYRRLRLTRDEAAWLHLHRISSFTETDLRKDAELIEMLDSCGCGHLVDVRGPDTELFPRTLGYAADVRRFLRLPEPRVVRDAA